MLIKPDVAQTIRRAREEQDRAHELLRTTADTLRESGASYRHLMAVRWLARQDAAAALPRPITGLAAEGAG